MNTVETEKPKVLVIDDEPAISRIIAIIARGLGRDTITVPDAETALALLPSVKPRLMLVDVRLPGIDGIEFVRRIREDQELSETPVLLMSAYGEPSAHAGDGFVPKPFDVDQLSDVIERYTTADA